MAFKRCPGCGRVWSQRDDLLTDPLVDIVGYQVNFQRLEAGLFLFGHGAPGCGTTLSVWASEFMDLYDGPMFSTRHTGDPGCPGYCLKPSELRACDVECECAFVRAVLDVARKWPKTTRPTTAPEEMSCAG